MKQFIEIMKLKENKGQKLDVSVFIKNKKNKNLMGINNHINSGTGIGEKLIQRLSNLSPAYIQPPNSCTIADAK